MDFIQNYVKPYGALRTVALTTIVLLVMSNVGWAFAFWHMLQKSVEQVYVVGQDGSYPARLQDQAAPSIFEGRNHVKRFMELMFAHDADNYGARIEQALHLIDKAEGMSIYKDFEASQVRDNYIKHGSRSIMILEAVELDMSLEPYQGQVWGRQRVIYKGKEMEMPISATFVLIRTRRSEANPFGLLIRQWKFIHYQKQEGGMG